MGRILYLDEGVTTQANVSYAEGFPMCSVFTDVSSPDCFNYLLVRGHPVGVYTAKIEVAGAEPLTFKGVQAGTYIPYLINIKVAKTFKITVSVEEPWEPTPTPDEWYNRFHLANETEEYNAWFAKDYGKPADFNQDEDSSHEFYVRKGFALMGWNAALKNAKA